MVKLLLDRNSMPPHIDIAKMKPKNGKKPEGRREKTGAIK